MAEAIGVVASIVSVLQLTGDVVEYLNDARNASEDVQRLYDEISSTSFLLYVLRDRVEKSQSLWLPTIAKLAEPRGPLDLFQQAVQALAHRLKRNQAGSRLARVKHDLIWPFRKAETSKLLEVIARQKASFALALQNDQLSLVEAMNQNVVRLAEDMEEVKSLLESQQFMLLGQEDRAILKWLNPGFSISQEDVLSRRHPGTGSWLLEHETFKAWVKHTGSILWCPGIPGAGKTVLSSVMVSHLRKTYTDPEVAVLCVYFNHKEAEKQTVQNVLKSLLQQLVLHIAAVPRDVKRLHDRKFSAELDAYFQVFSSVAASFEKVFIVLDAFDECTESRRSDLVSRITRLNNVNVVVTSRSIANIERDLHGAETLDIVAHDEDIRSYVKARMLRESKLIRHIQKDPSLESRIVDTVATKSQKMFLLAEQQMNSLAAKNDRRALRLAMNDLSSDIDMVYEEAMVRIADQTQDDFSLAHRLLLWTTFATRPLTLLEVQHALAIQEEDSAFDDEAMPDEEALLSVCAGLVTLDAKSNIIRLVHYTTEAYFQKRQVEMFPDAQAAMARSCLRYLLLDAFAEGACKSWESYGERVRTYSLQEYAAGAWAHHAKHSQSEMKPLILQLLQDGAKTASMWQCRSFDLLTTVAAMQRNGLGVALASIAPPSSFGLAALLGLEAIVTSLLREGIPVDADVGNNHRTTALMLAATSGEQHVCSILLDHGAAVDTQNRGGFTALHYAVLFQHKPVVGLLIQRSADTEKRAQVSLTKQEVAGSIRCTAGFSPLIIAVEEGHASIVRLLLERGADVDAADDLGFTALLRRLLQAQKPEEDEMVKLLLSVGADIHTKRRIRLGADGYAVNPEPSLLWRSESHYGSSMTVLQIACQRNEDIAQMLIKAGANVNCLDEQQRQPIHWASALGSVSLLATLLDAGADIEASYHRAQSAGPGVDASFSFLHEAAAAGHHKLIEVLLAVKSDVNRRSSYGSTALHEAANGNFAIATELLLLHGADPELRDRYDMTAYGRAKLKKHALVMKILQASTKGE